MNEQINVSSEIGTLKRVFIHAPDDGIGKIFPNRIMDRLFNNVIDLEIMRKSEYELFVQILLCFLDKKMFNKSTTEQMNCTDPKNENFFRSDYVIDLQWLLSDILRMEHIRAVLVSAVCANENVNYSTFQQLLKLENRQLANTLISGRLPTGKWIFPPIPNFTMTRDISIVINNHIVLGRLSKPARRRESTLIRFIVHNHPLFKDNCKTIELEDDETHFLLDEVHRDRCKITLEGSDFIMAASQHLMIGVSEHTTIDAARNLVKILHDNNVVEKVTLVYMPAQRHYMHLDMIVTQVKRNMWMIFSAICKDAAKQSSFSSKIKEDMKIKIEQFIKGEAQTKRFDYLEDLLRDISYNDHHWNGPVEFIKSGRGLFPESWREQWTDGCNVFAIKEGVIIMYDRNHETTKALQEKGMRIFHAKEFIAKVRAKEIDTEDITDTVILLPSGELSRTRAGPHCLTQPILRESI